MRLSSRRGVPDLNPNRQACAIFDSHVGSTMHRVVESAGRNALATQVQEIEPMITPNRLRNIAAPKLALTKKQTRHVTTDSLGLHVLGDLPIFQQTEVEEHLAECGSCRIALRRIAEVIAVFRAVPCEAAA
jgi:Putative zinc-finger